MERDRVLAMARFISVSTRVRDLEQGAKLAGEARDPEGVHGLRIAAKRIEVWLRAAKTRVLIDDVRWLRDACGRVRDLDVVLARDPPRPFRDWLVAERAAAHQELVRLLGSSRTGALISALECLGPIASIAVRAYARDQHGDVRRIGQRIDRGDSTADDMHALRRSLRRLRYAREWLGLGTRPHEEIQEELGALNDATVALALLDSCPRGPELAEFRASLAAEVERRLALSRAAWGRTRLGPGPTR